MGATIQKPEKQQLNNRLRSAHPYVMRTTAMDSVASPKGGRRRPVQVDYESLVGLNFHQPAIDNRAFHQKHHFGFAEMGLSVAPLSPTTMTTLAAKASTPANSALQPMAATTSNHTSKV